MESGWRAAGVISEFRGIWALPLVIEGLDGLRMGGWGPGIAAAGLIVTSGLLGVGGGMVFRLS